MASIHQETERVCLILKDLVAEWTDRRTALASVRSIFSSTNDKAVHRALATRFQGPLCAQLGDRRSIYCQEVCELITFIAQTLGEDFEELSKGYIAGLLPLLMVTISAIAGPAHTSIQSILPYSTSCILVIVDGVKDKHPFVRARCTEYMCTMLENAPLLAKLNSESYINAIDEGVRSAIGDSKPEARALAKRSYAVFSKQWPEHAQKLLAALDTTNQKRLQETTSKPAPAKKPGFAQFMAKKQAAVKPPAAHTSEVVAPNPSHKDDSDPDGNGPTKSPQSSIAGSNGTAPSSSSSSSASPAAPVATPGHNAAAVTSPTQSPVPSPPSPTVPTEAPTTPIPAAPITPIPAAAPITPIPAAAPTTSSPATSSSVSSSASSSSPAEVVPLPPAKVTTPESEVRFQPKPALPVLQDATNTVPPVDKPVPESASESPAQETVSSPSLVSAPRVARKRNLSTLKSSRPSSPPAKTIVKPVRATRSRLVALASSEDKENQINVKVGEKQPASKKLKIARGSPQKYVAGSTPIAARVKVTQRAAAVTAKRAFKF